MVKLQLVEIYAMSWRKRDVSILAPYLDDSFSYTSFWVYASLNRESYLDYFQQIARFMNAVGQEDRRTRMQRNNYPIECAKSYIAEHLGEPFRLEDIAKKTLLTPSYLSVLFKKEMGETISDYTQKLRLEKAKALLRTTNLNINEISIQVGYTDSKHFSKVFKKVLGVRPKEYRKMYSW